jgi:hypothetical protein
MTIFLAIVTWTIRAGVSCETRPATCCAYSVVVIVKRHGDLGLVGPEEASPLVEPGTPLKAGTFGEVDTPMEGALLRGGSCFGAAFWHLEKKVVENGLKLSATHNIRDGKLYYERTANGCSNTHLCFP